MEATAKHVNLLVAVNYFPRGMIKEFARQLSEGEATKADLIPRTCAICKSVRTIDVLEQLKIDKSDLGDDCQSCLGSEAE